MIRSMTGYGRADVAGTRLTVTVECKSLNHRSLDISLRLPRVLGSFELEARRQIQDAVKRGRVEVTVTTATGAGQAQRTVRVDAAQARAYARAAGQLARAVGRRKTVDLAWLMGQPGVLVREDEPELPAADGWTLLSQALGQALADLVARREAEGKALAQALRTLHDGLTAQVAAMEARVPDAVQRRAVRLRERVQGLLAGATLDEGRLATEIALLAERSDVREELDRLRTHLDQFTTLLEDGGSVGRTLDFLIQEMHREVNTVGSKADDLELTQLVIGAKATLEKLREQVQNLE